MAAQEYYLGTQSAHELLGNHRQPNLYPSPPNPQEYQHPPPSYPLQQYNAPTYANTPPPTYSAYPQQPQQPHGYPPEQPYPEKGPMPYPQQPQAYSLQQPPYREKSSQVMTAPYHHKMATLALHSSHIEVIPNPHASALQTKRATGVQV
jgi:hypothetical protein